MKRVEQQVERWFALFGRAMLDVQVLDLIYIRLITLAGLLEDDIDPAVELDKLHRLTSGQLANRLNLPDALAARVHEHVQTRNHLDRMERPGGPGAR